MEPYHRSRGYRLSVNRIGNADVAMAQFARFA